MQVMVFGATGMVGQGVLRECLADSAVDRVLTVGRSRTAQRHEKLSEITPPDLMDLAAFEAELTGFDACFFCLGVSAAAMSEERYSALTYDLTLAIARTLARLNPEMTFVYVSGAGTDSTERGRTMWARVKGRTENALFALPFRAAYMFRPGLIIPMHGVRSRTGWYRVFYGALTPLFPLLRRLFPRAITTTEQIGRAMLGVARRGYSKGILDPSDINAASARSTVRSSLPS
jgi:uncharacterized protein YbjT (DUF2867 family)